MSESNKVKIARLKEKLAHTYDNLDKAEIICEIEKLEKEEKAKIPPAKTTIKQTTDAPVIMDRKRVEPVDAHDIKSVNGVYQKDISVVTF